MIFDNITFTQLIIFFAIIGLISVSLFVSVSIRRQRIAEAAQAAQEEELLNSGQQTQD